MGVYIKGMEMPKTCGKCQIKNAIECNRWKLVRSVVLDRHKDCPLIPVPPHGRLIDADALRELYEEWENDKAAGIDMDKFHVSTPVIRQNIDDAPTIIPAEEGET